MRAELVATLACPLCRGVYACSSVEESEGRILYGSLACAACDVAVPICAGFPLFPEQSRPAAIRSRADLEALERDRMGEPRLFADFVRHKHRRPTRDAYAAFQPFNESTQALFPLVPLLRASMSPGDLILDLWCRTGWSGELLASLFPEQRVVSLWESNADVLGYRGFRYWLGEGERAANLDVILHPLGGALPFRAASFALVHGLDCLHRDDPDGLAGEALRLARPGGAVVFPHVHLANGQPEPYFDRGCRQLRGAEYRDLLGRRLEGSGRAAFVLSERALFEGEVVIADDADTEHYNALVAILPAAAAGRRAAAMPLDAAPPAGARPVINPMWTIDLHLARATIDGDALDGAVGRLLERHPIYRNRLEGCAPVRLSKVACELLFWADRCLTLDEIAGRCRRPLAEIQGAAAALAARELVQPRTVSRSMAVLQRFYAAQTTVEPPAAQNLASLWRRACDDFAARPLVVDDRDGSAFRYADAAEVATAVAAALTRAGVGRGDVVACVAPFGTEAAFVFWGCMQIGAVLAPLDATAPAEKLRALLARLQPRVVFCDPARAAVASDLAEAGAIVFDDGAAAPPAGACVFSDWIDAPDDAAPPAAVDPAESDVAVILQTSGTSGEPKGVELTHGALYRSGCLLARAYAWREDDVVLSTGEPHAVSGLRNPWVATLAAGASFVVAEPAARANPMALAEVIRRHQVTVLTTVPATLRLLAQHEGRLPRGGLASLRQVLSTGSPLPAPVAEAFRRRFGLPVLDYYGLTETTGLCIGVTPADADAPPGSIGRPLGCIAQIVGDDGEVLGAGETGELRIYGDNLMRGYRGAAAETEAALGAGWYATGDLARRDERGFLFLLSRRRDVIKDARGDLVHPVEIEAALMSHAEVADAGACGYVTAEGDERLAAFVVPRSARTDPEGLVEELRRHVMQRLGPRRVPAPIRLVERLPRGADGSLLRRVLAEELG